MVQGISPGDSVAVFVGYHAGAGAPGVLAHTFSSNFTELRVNGEPMTEAEVNGLYAASLGVPVGVVTGDDQICDVARKAFPGVSVVEVKRANGFSAADSLSPEGACTAIHDAVRSVVSAAASPRPVPVPEELVVEVDFASPLMADFAAAVPQTQRLSARTLRGHVDNGDDLLKLVMSWYYLAALAAQQLGSLVHRR